MCYFCSCTSIFLIPTRDEKINGEFQKGRFQRYPEDIALWKAAEKDGLINGCSYKPEPLLEPTFVVRLSAPDAQSKFKRLIAHEYIESKLMKEGFPYRNYLNDNIPNEYNFGAHDLTISDNVSTLEYVSLINKIKPKIFPNDFNNDWTKLDLITSQIINIFKPE